MATLTVYPDPGSGSTTCDGDIYANTNGSWTTVHDSASGGGYQVNNTADWIGLCSKSASGYTIIRSNFSFDTSPLTGAAVISAATISFCATGQATGNAHTTSFVVVTSTQANANNLAVTDYQSYGTTSFGSKALSTWTDTDGTYNTITLNATGIAAIQKTTVTKLGGRLQNDIDNSAPPSNGENRVYSYYADQASTTKDPKLVITYTISGGAFILNFI